MTRRHSSTSGSAEGQEALVELGVDHTGCLELPLVPVAEGLGGPLQQHRQIAAEGDGKLGGADAEGTCLIKPLLSDVGAHQTAEELSDQQQAVPAADVPCPADQLDEVSLAA